MIHLTGPNGMFLADYGLTSIHQHDCTIYGWTGWDDVIANLSLLFWGIVFFGYTNSIFCGQWRSL
jgi:hypothetical protein